MFQPGPPQYSFMPPDPPPSIVPAAYVDHLCLLAAQAQGAAVENERLRAKLTQKQLVEEAYRTVLAQSDGHTYTPGRNGTFIHLMNRTVERAFHVRPKPPMTSPPFYLVGLSQETGWLCLNEADYFNDKAFLTALQERPGVEVYPVQSQRQTAALHCVPPSARSCSRLRCPATQVGQRWRVTSFLSAPFRVSKPVCPVSSPSNLPNYLLSFRPAPRCPLNSFGRC